MTNNEFWSRGWVRQICGFGKFSGTDGETCEPMQRKDREQMESCSKEIHKSVQLVTLTSGKSGHVGEDGGSLEALVDAKMRQSGSDMALGQACTIINYESLHTLVRKLELDMVALHERREGSVAITAAASSGGGSSPTDAAGSWVWWKADDLGLDQIGVDRLGDWSDVRSTSTGMDEVMPFPAERTTRMAIVGSTL